MTFISRTSKEPALSWPEQGRRQKAREDERDKEEKNMLAGVAGAAPNGGTASGKLKLDDPLTKYAAGLTFKASIPDKVAVRDLLIHTSGLRNGPLTFRMAFSAVRRRALLQRPCSVSAKLVARVIWAPNRCIHGTLLPLGVRGACRDDPVRGLCRGRSGRAEAPG